MQRPSDLFDREQEWADLVAFASAPGAGIHLGVVSGRRRQGKSMLLRRLVEAADGFYTMALEQEREPALQRMAGALADALGLPAGALALPDWSTAWRTLLRPRRADRPYVVVVDELPYLLRHSPELPSTLQEVVDESRDDPSWPPVRLILCGSALAVMGELLSGTRALRGRARLDLTVRAFDVRQTAAFWEAPDPVAGFALHAVVGGTPGYRDLIGAAPGPGQDALFDWLGASLLNPSHAMFREAEYLLTEDPRLTDRALYHSVLGAVSNGARTPTALGGVLGRPVTSLEHPLSILAGAGYLRRDDDVLLQRRPRLRVSDPVIRFDQVVRRPRLAQLEERRTAAAWADSQAAFSSAVLGPHFEDLARWWTARHEGWPGRSARWVRPWSTTVPDAPSTRSTWWRWPPASDGRRRTPRSWSWGRRRRVSGHGASVRFSGSNVSATCWSVVGSTPAARYWPCSVVVSSPRRCKTWRAGAATSG